MYAAPHGGNTGQAPPAARPSRPWPRLPGAAALPVVLSVGLLQMATPTALMLFTLPLVDAGRASLLAFTHPLWVAPLAAMARGERLDARAAAGLAFGMAGLAVLFNPLAFDLVRL